MARKRQCECRRFICDREERVARCVVVHLDEINAACLEIPDSLTGFLRIGDSASERPIRWRVVQYRSGCDYFGPAQLTAAYAIARLVGRAARRRWWMWLLTQRFLPPVVLLAPYFLLLRACGLLDSVAGPDAGGQKLLTEAAERMKLTARGYHRVLRVARTIADLSGAANVTRAHIAEALSYRRIHHAG